MKISTALGTIFLLLISAAAQAENSYIQARQAQLFAKPSLKASVVTVSHKGDEVVIEQRQGRWVKVKLGDKSGWVSRLLLGKAPPKEKITVLDDGQGLEQSARRRASATAATAAARGLRGEERARQSDAAASNFDALQKVEQEGVSEDEALHFMQQERDTK